MKNKIEQAKKLLEAEGFTIIKDNEKWLKIPELNIEVEIEVHNKNKSWNDLKLSEREDELLTVGECIFLANHPKYSKILKMDGSSSEDDFFIKQPFNLNKKNGYVALFIAYSDRAILYCGRLPSNSNRALGVRLVRRKKISGVKK